LVVRFERRHTFKPEDASHFNFPASLRLHPWGPQANQQLGGIMLGAGLTLCATFVVESWKRRQLAHDLGAALYHELANRVARCCYDFEDPWCGYLFGAARLDRFTIGKFAPEPPTIFNANADKVAMFGDRAPAAMMAFYFRLAVLKRDIENIRDDPRDHIYDKYTRIIASRFAATLDPGLRALDALASMVSNTATIEADALDTFDSVLPRPQREATNLRELLTAMIALAKKIESKT
jgi:hypothetical protein